MAGRAAGPARPSINQSIDKRNKRGTPSDYYLSGPRLELGGVGGGGQAARGVTADGQKRCHGTGALLDGLVHGGQKATP